MNRLIHPRHWNLIQPAPRIAALLMLLLIVRPLSADDRAHRLDRACVLLTNDMVVFGEAQQIGEFVIVRSGPGDQVRLPRTQVACWANSLADLYRFRADHRSPADLEALLRDVRWCVQYGLFDQADEALRRAAALAPGHPEVVQLQGQLQRRSAARDSAAQAARPQTASQPNPTIVAARPPEVRTTAFREPAALSDDDGPANRADPRTLRLFASHVQPTLMNKCGRCHHQQAALDWRLHTMPIGTRPTARLTRENLAATLQFVDAADPGQSPLLLQATSPHGGIDAPLTARNATAIESLRQWLLLAGNRQPPPEPSHIEPAPSGQQGGEPVPEIAPVAYQDESEQPLPAVLAPIGTPRAAPLRTAVPQRLPQVQNPFDADLFNRRFHSDDPRPQ
jgi:hypothetical protein